MKGREGRGGERRGETKGKREMGKGNRGEAGELAPSNTKT